MALERVLIRPSADVRELDPAADTAELATIDYAGAMVIGGTNATSLALGSVGVTVTVLGNLQVDGTTTLVDTMTAQGDVNLGDGGDTINIGSGATDTVVLKTDMTVSAGVLIDLATNGGYINLPTEVQAPATDGTDGYLRLNVSGAPDVLEWLDLGGTVWRTVAWLGGVTLDYAYDGGGAGLGRAVTVDSGAIEFTGSNAADYTLEVTNSGNGGVLFVNNTGTGLTIDIQDGGGNVFNIADGGAFDLDSAAFDLHATGNVTIDCDAVIDIDAVTSLDIDCSAGSIGLGTTPVNFPINIGTSGVRTITVGNVLATELQLDALIVDINADTELTLDAKHGFISLDSFLSSNFTITADNAGDQTLLISATNIGAGDAIVAISATDAVTIDSTAAGISLDAYTNSNFGITGNDAGTLHLAFDCTNAGAGEGHVDVTATDRIKLDSRGDVLIDAVDDVEINSSTGSILIGNDNVAQPISIGTGAAARTITIGNATGATAVDILSGTGGINLHDGVAQLDLDGAGALTETSLVSADITPSGALTLRGGGISQFGDDTGYFEFNGAGSMKTTGITSMSIAGSGAVSLKSTGNLLSFSDSYQIASTYASDLVLSDASAEWDTFETNFGEVSILNALNQCASSAVTLDEAYNASAGASTITVDAGDLTWNEVGAYSFIVDISGCTGIADGFSVEDGGDYFRFTHAAANTLNLRGELDQVLLSCSSTVDIDAAGAFSINSSAGVINIGDDAVAQAINIGTGASARTITVGNAASTEIQLDALLIDINAGATGLTIDSGSTIGITAAAGSDVTISARGSATTWNEADAGVLERTALDGFAASSIIGGMNELHSNIQEIHTLAAATLSFNDTSVTSIHVSYTGTGAVTITVDSDQIAIAGRTFTIKDTGLNAAANSITVETEGAEEIEGEANLVMAVDGMSITLQSDGSNLWII